MVTLYIIKCAWDYEINKILDILFFFSEGGCVAISHFTGRKGLFRYYIFASRIVLLIVFTLIG